VSKGPSGCCSLLWAWGRLEPGGCAGPADPIPAALGVLGLQELGLHAGHLPEVLGVRLRALHLAPADGHHLRPWGQHPSGAPLPKPRLLPGLGGSALRGRMGQNRHRAGPCPYRPRCVPPPRPARSPPYSAGSWTVRRPARSGQVGVKGTASPGAPERTP